MMSRGLFLLALLAVACKQGAALKCYICDSLTNEHCGDPIDTNEITTTDCSVDKAKDFMNKITNAFSTFAQNAGYSDMFPPGVANVDMACQKMKYNENGGKEVVLRTCILSKSTGMCSQSFSSKDAFFCDQCETDGCNGAGQLGAFSLLFYLIFPSILALLALRS